MAKRLGGKGVAVPNRKTLDRIHLYSLASMEEAIGRVQAGFGLPPFRRKTSRPEYQRIPRPMLHGDEHLERILAVADQLVDAALLEDPRLVRRSAWVRAEEGLDACSALIAAGEERACLDRRKLRLSEQATGEPVRIVVSTDSKEIRPQNAAAFIAAAKLAQQFRPLEIWWQGAWLKGADAKDPAERGFGHVFHVPLVLGDMDFRRLQFVLGDPVRDVASYFIMVSFAWPAGLGWGGGVGEESFLPNTHDYIRESGLKHDPVAVARYAARWAGLEPRWVDAVSAWHAEQHWTNTTSPVVSSVVDEATRRRWQQDEQQRQMESTRLANERLIV